LYKVEKAKIKDVAQMHKLINHFADLGEMLARPLSELYEDIRDYFIVREGDKVIACAALHVSWSDLAEVKAMAVDKSHQKKGIGRELLKALMAEARELGIPGVFCLTYKPAFFEAAGFSQVDKMTLPKKVWTECFRCPKFPDCEEVALVYNFD
jgi:amino-acid N-acetyltransferase